VGAPYLARAAGRVWLEVEVLATEGGEMAAYGAKGVLLVGLVGACFRGNIVGDDRVSWAVMATVTGEQYKSFHQ
jgi:hypothetical protein